MELDSYEKINTGSVIMSDIRKYMKDRKNIGITEESEDDAVLEEKLRKHKRMRTFRTVAIGVVIVLLFIAYILYDKNRVYTEYKVIDTVEVSDSHNSRFYGFGDYVLRYSEDGLAYLNGSKTYWNQAFEMDEPVIDICDKYVAIAEQKGNVIYIYNTDEQQGKVETEYPVIALDVSANGVVAAITEESSDVSYIEVISKDGTKIAKGQTILSGQGCPVDLSISEDGTKLAVSYLYVGSGVIESKVVFYNYSEIGKNEVDRFVGGFNYDKIVVAKVEFLDNDTVVAFGEGKAVLYSMKQKPSVIKEIAVDKEIKSVFYCEDNIGMVVKNGEIDNKYTMLIYDTSGRLVSETPFDFEYKDIKMSEGNIIMYNDISLKVYTVDGKEKYSGDMEEKINSIIMHNDRYKYYVIGASDIKTIKLK